MSESATDEARALRSGLAVQAAGLLAQLAALAAAGLLGLALWVDGSRGGFEARVVPGFLAGVVLFFWGLALILSVLAGGLCASGPAGRIRGLGLGGLALAALLLFETPGLGFRLWQMTSTGPRAGDEYLTFALFTAVMLEVGRLSTLGWLASEVGGRAGRRGLRLWGGLFCLLMPFALPSILMSGLILAAMVSRPGKGDEISTVLAIFAGISAGLVLSVATGLVLWACAAARPPADTQEVPTDD